MACPDCTDVGDTVMLNSGGPLMTVTDVSNVYAECSWFDGDALQRADFTFAAIERIGPDDEFEVDELGYPVCQPAESGIVVGYPICGGSR